jgi:glycerol-3-phosphate responsive antiterminator
LAFLLPYFYFQQYVFIYRCVLEILLAVHGLKNTDEVAAFIKEYNNVVARKATIKTKQSVIKSTSKLEPSDKAVPS